MLAQDGINFISRVLTCRT